MASLDELDKKIEEMDGDGNDVSLLADLNTQPEPTVDGLGVEENEDDYIDDDDGVEEADEDDVGLEESGIFDDNRVIEEVIDDHNSGYDNESIDSGVGTNIVGNGDAETDINTEMSSGDMVTKKDEIIDTDAGDEDSGYDPVEQFKLILSDAGLKRGIKAMSDSFFNGDIDSPDWLNYILMQAGIGKKQRNLVLMSYYGAPPSELGVKDDINENIHYQKNRYGKSLYDKSNEHDDAYDKEVKKMEISNLESVKRELALKKMKKESLYLDSELNNIGKKEEPVKTPNMRTVQKPLFDENGKVRRDSEGRIIAERVTEPINENSQSSDMFSMMSAMMQLVDRQNDNKRTGDPEVAELKNMVTGLATQQKDASHASEVERLRTENERIRTQFQDDIKRMEDTTRDRMDREHAEHMRQLEDMQRMFADKLEQRDRMGELVGAYERKVDDLKETMREHQSTIKDTVVKQATTTADKLTTQVGSVVEGAVGPFTEMMKQQYQTNIELFRQQHGLSGSPIPSTSEEELAAYIGDE